MVPSAPINIGTCRQLAAGPTTVSWPIQCDHPDLDLVFGSEDGKT